MTLTDKLKKYSGIALDLATIGAGAAICDFAGNYEFDNFTGSMPLSAGVVAGYHIARNITHDFKTHLTNRNYQGISTALVANLIAGRVQEYSTSSNNSIENWTIFTLAAMATTISMWEGKKEENKINRLKR